VHTVQNAQQRHDFGEFFSDLASKYFELLASLASALKILLPPLYIGRITLTWKSDGLYATKKLLGSILASTTKRVQRERLFFPYEISQIN
jgi:hypothetical protein